MKWTAEDVRVACGLQPFPNTSEEKDEYRRSIRDTLSEEAWLESRDRQTGRTTKMVCEALATLANGQDVLIFALAGSVDAIRGMLNRWAEQGKIPLRGKFDVRSAKMNQRIFCDHILEGK